MPLRAWQAHLTKGQKKKLRHKENKAKKKQRLQEDSQKEERAAEVPAGYRGRTSEWLTGIRQQPLQVRLDLMLWTRRAAILHGWREQASWVQRGGRFDPL